MAGCVDDGEIVHRSEAIDWWRTPSSSTTFQIPHTLGVWRVQKVLRVGSWRLKRWCFRAYNIHRPEVASTLTRAFIGYLTQPNTFFFAEWTIMNWRSRFIHARVRDKIRILVLRQYDVIRPACRLSCHARACTNNTRMATQLDDQFVKECWLGCCWRMVKVNDCVNNLHFFKILAV